MKKKIPPQPKLTKLDLETFEDYDLDPKTATPNEKRLMYHAATEKWRRINLQIFIRWQAKSFVDFLEGRGEWAPTPAGKGKRK